MGPEKRDFDHAATHWDEKPERLSLAHDITVELRRMIPLQPDMDVLDFGCGTGLITLELQPLVHSITGVDSSRGMLAMLEAKIATLKLSNVRTRFVDMDAGDTITGRYHLIVSSMTMHHIDRTDQLLSQLAQSCYSGGFISIADLDPDNGMFHSDSTGVYHQGFDRAKLQEELRAAGFEDIQAKTAATVHKNNAKGEMQDFSVFLITGRKALSGG